MRITLDQATTLATERAKTYGYWYVVIQSTSDGWIQVMHQDDADAAKAQHPDWYRVLHVASPTKKEI